MELDILGWWERWGAFISNTLLALLILVLVVVAGSTARSTKRQAKVALNIAQLAKEQTSITAAQLRDSVRPILTITIGRRNLENGQTNFNVVLKNVSRNPALNLDVRAIDIFRGVNPADWRWAEHIVGPGDEVTVQNLDNHIPYDRLMIQCSYTDAVGNEYLQEQYEAQSHFRGKVLIFRKLGQGWESALGGTSHSGPLIEPDDGTETGGYTTWSPNMGG